jgi:hypothetical protein
MQRPAETGARKEPDQERLCPLLEAPEPDCYCVDPDSLKISLLLSFCRGNYRRCMIYQRIMA